MQKISEALIDNPYIANCEDTVFTSKVTHYIANNKKIKPRLPYVHGLLKYPAWTADTDIFQFIRKKIRKRIQKNSCFFVFDSSTEGFSPIDHFPFFDMLYYNCEKYSIDPKMIIYVSSNLKDENNIKEYAKKHSVTPINVFSFVSFERVLAVDDKKIYTELEIQYNKAKDSCNQKFNNKYFSSLSRVNREYRSAATFLLCQESFYDKALISHDTVNPEYIYQSLKNYDVDFDTIKKWCTTLPLTVDRDDFNRNWAVETPYNHIYDQTLFQIVNETLVLDYNQTSLFYSEKTFRPVACFQPFLIYGQQGCNKKLEELGYKLFYNLFDYDFDEEADPILRYKKLLITVKKTINYLDSLSRKERIEWRFKNEEILKHNFTTMLNSKYSDNKLNIFLKQLEKRCLN